MPGDLEKIPARLFGAGILGLAKKQASIPVTKQLPLQATFVTSVT
tara:strand:- start:1002 stop:1136 length:135 start_codon:yes stop_codon:yes gene_type:complete